MNLNFSGIDYSLINVSNIWIIVYNRYEFLPTIVYIFTVAQWFGIPTYGGIAAAVYAVVMLLMLVALESGAIWKLVRTLAGWATNSSNGRVIDRLSGSIFYGNAILSLILSWKLVYSWRLVSYHWARAETTEGMYFPPDGSIKRRIVAVTTFITVFAFAEHVLSMISATGFEIPPEEYFQRYILNSHGFLFQRNEYTLWLAVPVFFLSKFATILWNFQDLIIILVSMGLASRYRRMNTFVRQLVRVEKKNNDVEKFGTELYAQLQVWRRLRSAYVRQSQLVRMVDGYIGPLILLSNLNNFYFICLQLYLGINKKDDGSMLNDLYYFFSLGWLLARACCVVLAAAEVHQQSRQALPLLFRCPTSSYNIEIKRLKNQLAHEWVALSGMGFFYLDRQLLLEVAAAILKYELVLIQYDR